MMDELTLNQNKVLLEITCVYKTDVLKLTEIIFIHIISNSIFLMLETNFGIV